MSFSTNDQAMKMYGLNNGQWQRVRKFNILQGIKSKTGRVIMFENTELLAKKAMVLERLKSETRSPEEIAQKRRETVAKNRLSQGSSRTATLRRIESKLDTLLRYHEK